MGIIIAAAAALVYGAADFFGGLASKRNAVWKVVFGSGVAGLATAALTLPFLGQPSPAARDLALGAALGVVSLGSLSALYRGLAIGRMSVVAPTTAVVASIVPIIYGVVRGERPSLAAILGIVLALGAVALVSRSSDEDVSGAPEPQRAGLVLALIAGFGFGLAYVLLAASSRGAWPLVAARTVGAGLIGFAALLRRVDLRPAKGTLRTVLLGGVLDMGGNLLYLISLRYTLIAIAAVVTSLYPASTVMLARIVLHERLHAVQWAGVACALAGVVLMALG